RARLSPPPGRPAPAILIPPGGTDEFPGARHVSAQSALHVQVGTSVFHHRLPLVGGILDGPGVGVFSYLPGQLVHLPELGPVRFADGAQERLVHAAHLPDALFILRIEPGTSVVCGGPAGLTRAERQGMMELQLRGLPGKGGDATGCTRSCSSAPATRAAAPWPRRCCA